MKKKRKIKKEQRSIPRRVYAPCFALSDSECCLSAVLLFFCFFKSSVYTESSQLRKVPRRLGLLLANQLWQSVACSREEMRDRPLCTANASAQLSFIRRQL